MFRYASIVAGGLLAAPVLAGTYSAIPVSKVQPAQVVTRDVAWKFTNGAFAGRTEQSRPVVLCQGLAKKVGPLASFFVDGRPLSVGDLAKCNGVTPGHGTSAITR